MRRHHGRAGSDRAADDLDRGEYGRHDRYPRRSSGGTGEGDQARPVDVVPRYEKDGSARIRDFMASGLNGFESLDEAADAVAAYLPYRSKPRSPEGLKKNLRLRDGRWYWHWIRTS